MATVQVSWATQDEEIPNAATFTQFQVQILQGANVIVEAIEPLGTGSHTFLNIGAGEYVASVVLEDPAGNDSAPPVTAAFSVPQGATAPVVVGVTVNLT